MTRFFDILFSLLATIVLLPFMIPIIIGLKLTGEHDAFYTQERIGRYGKPFKLLEFATMLRNSANMPGGLYTTEDDPRILPMGKFLRKTKINELPQLLNILRGDMSVIGYRPTTKYFYDQYTEEVRKNIHNLRPGLSGIGSVVFRDQDNILDTAEDKDKFYSEVISPYKGALEAWYSKHNSLLTYFKLIFLTVVVVLKPSSRLWMKILPDLPPVPEKLKGLV